MEQCDAGSSITLYQEFILDCRHHYIRINKKKHIEPIHMLLNEDFFDDIEIKDEDLTAEEPILTAIEPNENTLRELLKHKITESEMFLWIRINLFYNPVNIWHRIKRIMKRLKYMFDIYNINLSEPFLTYDIIDLKQLEDEKFSDDYTFIQHDGCILYFPKDELRKYGPDGAVMDEELNLFVFLDKKIPVFKTARHAYNFVNNLNKCIWKDATNQYEYEYFEWYDFYNNINENDLYPVCGIHYVKLYENDNADNMFDSIKKLVPEEVAEQLMHIKLSNFSVKQIKKNELENIIKMMN